MTPVRPPLRVHAADGGSYYVVWDAANKVIARGSLEICDAVAKGLPIFADVGDLFGRPPLVNNQPWTPTVHN
jgi:hypothetical protein